MISGGGPPEGGCEEAIPRNSDRRHWLKDVCLGHVAVKTKVESFFFNDCTEVIREVSVLLSKRNKKKMREGRSTKRLGAINGKYPSLDLICLREIGIGRLTIGKVKLVNAFLQPCSRGPTKKMAGSDRVIRRGRRLVEVQVPSPGCADAAWCSWGG